MVFTDVLEGEVVAWGGAIREGADAFGREVPTAGQCLDVEWLGGWWCW